MFCNNTPESINDIRQKIANISAILSQFSWLADAFVLDFFVENHWERLPRSWQEILDNSSLPEFANWLDPRIEILRYNRVWPLSLQALRIVLLSNSVPRIRVNNIEAFLEKTLLHTQHREKVESHGVQHENLKHNYRHIKPKKFHEIEQLSRVISSVLKESDCNNVVDVGSGQGHLSRILALVHGYRVLSMEAVGSHVGGAQKYDLQAIREFTKRKTFTDIRHLPQQFQIIVEEDMSEQEFEQIIMKALGNESSSFALVGLHTCGNLASTMLRLFTESKRAFALISISCCYMKLVKMFPQSNFVSNLMTSQLSYAALEVACHAIEQHSDKLRDTNADKLKVHCYRAALEQLIREHYPDKIHLGLSVKNAHTMSFLKYAEIALQKGNLKFDLHGNSMEVSMSQWKRVILFYSLRIAIAPLIESLVLLDRMLYLSEKGIPCTLVPIFDTAVSPRNHVLVAIK